MKKTTEEMKRATFRFIDDTCKDIAQARRMSEIEGIDVEEFDVHLNECCTKWAEYYRNMSPIKLALDGIKDIIAAGHGEDLMNDLIEKIGGGDDEQEIG